MKKSNNFWRFIGIVVVLVALALFVGSSLYSRTTNKAEQPVEQTKNASITLSIAGLYEQKPVSISENETPLSVLEALDKTDSSLSLTTKAYSGMGILVTGIGAQKNGTGDSYWQYKVNDIQPLIGADRYQLKNGDTVEWFFGPSQEQ